MGTCYKGSSQYYRSVGQNILIASNTYNYQNGYFGENSMHGSKSTRNIKSSDNMNTAKDFYKKLAFWRNGKTCQ